MRRAHVRSGAAKLRRARSVLTAAWRTAVWPQEAPPVLARRSVRCRWRLSSLDGAPLARLRLIYRARSQHGPERRCPPQFQRQRVTAVGALRWAAPRKRRAVDAWLERIKVRALADVLSRRYPPRAPRLSGALFALLPAAACVRSPNPARFTSAALAPPLGSFGASDSRDGWRYMIPGGQRCLRARACCQDTCFASTLRRTWPPPGGAAAAIGRSRRKRRAPEL